MCSQFQLTKLSEEIVKCYREVYGANIVGIYLYGSYARGDYDLESDVDITAIVKGERSILQRELKKIWDQSVDIGLDYDVIVSPTVIPYEEYELYKEKLPYYRNIRTEGKKIG